MSIVSFRPASVCNSGTLDMQKIARAAAAGLGWGVGVGLALGMTGRLGGSLRPVAKGAVKGAIVLTEAARHNAAETREKAEDIYHEALVELAAERAARESVEMEGRPMVLPRG
jgi:hypothetical protein